MTTIKHEEGRVRTADGLDLYCQSWTPEQAKARVVLVHGAFEHSGRYHHVGRALAERGFACHGLDQRAHGKSPGAKVHIERYADFLADVAAMRSKLSADEPDLPLFLFGHSQGGLVVLRLVVEDAAGVAGVVVTSPFLGIHPSSRPSALLAAAARVLSKALPGLRLDNGLDAAGLSHDRTVVEAYRADPLVSHKASSRWLTETLAAHEQVLAMAGRLSVPTLVIQAGGDTIVDGEATKRWVAAAPAALVEHVVLEGLYHEVLNEPEKAEVLDRIGRWLDARVAGAGAAA
jgi:alpha-beta hydrolase superfamily lysophospholipase